MRQVSATTISDATSLTLPQNVAEIDEISWSQEIKKVILPAAERAIYLELEHYLRAIDMTVKRNRKSESDREKRLAQALGESRCVCSSRKVPVKVLKPSA